MPKVKHKPEPKHHHGRPGASRTLDGTVEAYNFSPKGGVEGLLLREGDRVVQVNLPPDAWPSLAAPAAVGRPIRVAVAEEPRDPKHPEGDHPVFRFVAIETADGPGSADPSPPIGPGVTVEGVVARLNYAKHGEANGVVLDTGDFVHLKPGGMKALGLKVGQAIVAEGTARPMALGNRAIEAEAVDGRAVRHAHPDH